MRLSIDTKAILKVKTLGCDYDGDMAPEEGYNDTVIDLENGGRIFVKADACIYVYGGHLLIEQ